jgi:predicted nucleic acid-binding protein
VADAIVVNASPLILLSRGKHLNLLHHFAERILLPEPVAREIEAKGPEDVTVLAIRNTSWIEIVPPLPIPQSILLWGLGNGESAVLAFACANPGMEAVLDDLPARKCAAGLDIPVRGTLGIVLAAKQRGFIPQARPILEDLLANGFYLSQLILRNALKRVGE